MSNNKMAVKPMYKCAICESVFETIEERMNCERKCLIDEQIKAKKAEEERKAKERDTRYKEVCEALDKANELKRAYLDDYGCFVYDSTHEFTCDTDITDLVKKFWYQLP